MDTERKRIKALLETQVRSEYNVLQPATEDQIQQFCDKAGANGVPQSAIEQLVDLYSVANGFYAESHIGFHSCEDDILFEWWEDKELWLSSKDLYVIRWKDDRFCLGDASDVSFSEDFEFDTISALIEACVKEINENESGND